jgi:hypothetical protein
MSSDGELNIGNEAVIEPTAEDLVRKKGSAKVHGLHNNGLIVVIVAINFGNDVRNTTRMHRSGNGKLQVAELWVRSVDHATILSVLERYFISIPSAYGCSRTRDFAKKIFPLLRTEFRIAHGTTEMVYLPVSGDSLNAPREGIE